VRNLGLIVALWLTAFLPINSFALGLGEIEVNSFLNQPLNAEIQVISARPGEIDDLLVSLASREAFSRAGLERPLHLSDLKFTVRKNESGDSAVIVVTTRDSIKEPFLNFLIEADWSKGRLLREFTVLLDPPFYADQPAAAETLGQSSLPAATDDATASDSMSSSWLPMKLLRMVPLPSRLRYPGMVRDRRHPPLSRKHRVHPPVANTLLTKLKTSSRVMF